MENKPLNFYQCIQLLSSLVNKNIVQRDPNNANNILVYRNATNDFPEGFYSENLMTVASELVGDIEGQTYLVEQLEKEVLAEKSFEE